MPKKSSNSKPGTKISGKFFEPSFLPGEMYALNTTDAEAILADTLEDDLDIQGEILDLLYESALR
jgi:hypothetical protein